MKLSCLFVYESHQLTPPMEICGYTFTTQTTSIWKGYWTDILEFFSVFTLIMSFLIRRCNLENNHRAISPESWKEIRNRRVINDFEKDSTLPAKCPLSHPSLSLALSYGNSLPMQLILSFSTLGPVQWLCSFSSTLYTIL